MQIYIYCTRKQSSKKKIPFGHILSVWTPINVTKSLFIIITLKKNVSSIAAILNEYSIHNTSKKIKHSIYSTQQYKQCI